jgi:inner membrane protein involved in colicin E2 resistance
MTFRRLAAIAMIFAFTTAAWGVLGSSLVARAGEFDHRLEQEVQRLWGAPQRQVAPSAWVDMEDFVVEVVDTKDANGTVTRKEVRKPALRADPIGIASTRATVDLALEHRRKGLIWYATYAVAFKANYTFQNPTGQERTLRIRFPLPAQDALYDDFVFAVDGRPVAPSGDIAKEMRAAAAVPPGGTIRLDVGYRSRGLDTWTYAFAEDGVAQVRDFQLQMNTNFADVDYPSGTVSPSDQTQNGNGRQLNWTFANLISGQAIGMKLPQKLNPGPFAARVTFFAPVSLLFFFTVMVMVGATYGPSLHPMHYWFLSAAFFAFHLLLAYLVDHVGIHVAFALSAVVSVLLVVTYLRLITGMRHAVTVAGSAQAIFLVLFSYAFFFEGFTGLTITVGAILTLFALMQMTAHVRWDDIFSGRQVSHAREHADALQ